MPSHVFLNEHARNIATIIFLMWQVKVVLSAYILIWDTQFELIQTAGVI